jgi:uncharacterized protein YpmB
MENNNMENNTVVSTHKKNGLLIIIIVIIIIVIVTLVYVKKANNIPSQNNTETELNKAVETDTTISINSSLDNINLDDTSATDLQEIDKELQNL